MKYVQYLSFVTFWTTELAFFYFAILDRLGLTRNLPGRISNTGGFDFYWETSISLAVLFPYRARTVS